MKIKSNNGANILEYIALILIIVSAYIVMKEVISRGLFSKYKSSGESFAFGRQYDPKTTTVCKEDVVSFNPDGSAGETIMYDEDCYHARVSRPVSEGGCNQCMPNDDISCFQCEDRIKRSCRKAYCYQ
jgi:hypothetical protein